jgi:DNA invertase Pin-like site-specific DNA recombinase
MRTKSKQAQGGGVIGYVRVSTARQGDRGISLEVQETAIYRFAQSCGLPVLAIHRDIASGRGRRSLHLREGLRKALEACRTQDAILVVWDWSRLSREASTEDDLAKLFPLRERVHSISDDESLEAARRNARIAHAQEMRDAISDRTKSAMAAQKRDGKTFGNPDIKKVQLVGRDAWTEKSEEIVRSIAAVLRSLPDWKALKRSEIAEELNRRGLRTGHHLPWNKSRVRGPLERAEAMLGEEEDDEAMRRHPTYGLF